MASPPHCGAAVAERRGTCRSRLRCRSPNCRSERQLRLGSQSRSLRPASLGRRSAALAGRSALPQADMSPPFQGVEPPSHCRHPPPRPASSALKGQPHISPVGRADRALTDGRNPVDDSPGPVLRRPGYEVPKKRDALKGQNNVSPLQPSAPDAGPSSPLTLVCPVRAPGHPTPRPWGVAPQPLRAAPLCPRLICPRPFRASNRLRTAAIFRPDLLHPP